MGHSIQNLEDPDLHAGNQQLSDGFFLGLHNQKPPTSENFNHPTSAENKKQTRWLFDKITGHVEVIRSTYDVQGDAGRDDSAKWAKTEILADRLLTTVRVLGYSLPFFWQNQAESIGEHDHGAVCRLGSNRTTSRLPDPRKSWIYVNACSGFLSNQP